MAKSKAFQRGLAWKAGFGKGGMKFEPECEHKISKTGCYERRHVYFPRDTSDVVNRQSGEKKGF